MNFKKPRAVMLKQSLTLVRIILNCVFIAGLGAQSPYYQHHAKGWHWYEEQSADDSLQSAEDKNAQKDLGQPAKHKTPTEVVADYRKELENRLAKAWIDPSPHNMLRYQEMQKDMLDRSKGFSESWMHNVFLNPSLDHTLVSPVNQKAVHVKLDLEKKLTKQTIANLSKEYGLFFFFSGDCEFCHQFAPIVKQFSEQYGWEVLAISLDGKTLEIFPNAQPDNGLFDQWQQDDNRQVIPALYAVNPNTGHVIPIAFGMTSIDQMETRIMAIVGGKR